MFAKLLTAEFAEGKEIAEKIVGRESDTSECGQLTALLSAPLRPSRRALRLKAFAAAKLWSLVDFEIIAKISNIPIPMNILARRAREITG